MVAHKVPRPRFVFSTQQRVFFCYLQKATELLAANLPSLKNNLCYSLGTGSFAALFAGASDLRCVRVCVLLEDDLFADVDYLAMHVAEGYGILRVMDVNETPNARDVVVYRGFAE